MIDILLKYRVGFIFLLTLIDEETETQLKQLPQRNRSLLCLVPSRTFHTYSSNETHEEEESNAEEDVCVHAPLNLAAFIPWAIVVQHGFCLMAFERK